MIDRKLNEKKEQMCELEIIMSTKLKYFWGVTATTTTMNCVSCMIYFRDILVRLVEMKISSLFLLSIHFRYSLLPFFYHNKWTEYRFHSIQTNYVNTRFYSFNVFISNWPFRMIAVILYYGDFLSKSWSAWKVWSGRQVIGYLVTFEEYL